MSDIRLATLRWAERTDSVIDFVKLNAGVLATYLVIFGAGCAFASALLTHLMFGLVVFSMLAVGLIGGFLGALAVRIYKHTR